MALREIIADFVARVDDSEFSKLDKTIGKLRGSLLGLGAALAVRQLASFIDETARAADHVGKAAQQLSVSTSALQEWGYAAELSGSSAEQFEGTIRQLLQSLKEMSQDQTGQGAKAKAFRTLGVQAKDAQGNLRGVEQLLPELADGLAKVQRDTERAALALTVFGESATPLLPLFSQGSEGIAKLRAEFRELGGGFQPEAIQQSADYADQMSRLEVVVKGLKSRGLSAILPTIEAFGAALTKVGAAITWLQDRTNLFEAGLFVLGGRVAWLAASWIAANQAMVLATVRAWAPIIGRFLLATAKITALVLVVDDLVTTFRGGKSAIGTFVDSVFGVGAARNVVISLRQAFDDVNEAALRAAKAIGLYDGPILSADQVREQRRQEAVRTADVEAFVAEGPAGLSREDALQSFREFRRRYLREHPEATTDKDRADGIAPPQAPRKGAGKGGRQVSASAPAPSVTPPALPPPVTTTPVIRDVLAPVAARSTVVNAPSTLNMTVTVTDTKDAAKLKAAVREALEEHTRRVNASVAREVAR